MKAELKQFSALPSTCVLPPAYLTEDIIYGFTGDLHWETGVWWGVDVTAWDPCLVTPELVPFKQ